MKLQSLALACLTILAGCASGPSSNPAKPVIAAAVATQSLNDADKAFVQSLMQKPIYDPKQMAHWIAPPRQGIKGRPIEFEYVRHA